MELGLDDVGDGLVPSRFENVYNLILYGLSGTHKGIPLHHFLQKDRFSTFVLTTKYATSINQLFYKKFFLILAFFCALFK